VIFSVLLAGYAKEIAGDGQGHNGGAAALAAARESGEAHNDQPRSGAEPLAEVFPARFGPGVGKARVPGRFVFFLEGQSSGPLDLVRGGSPCRWRSLDERFLIQHGRPSRRENRVLKLERDVADCLVSRQHCPTAGSLNVGAVANGGVVKSNRSVMSFAALSRSVRLGRPKRVSMNFRIDVWS